MLTHSPARRRSLLACALVLLGASTGMPARAQPAAPSPGAPAQALTPTPAQMPPPAAGTPETAPEASPAASPASAGALHEDDEQALDDEARQRFELGRTFYEAGRFGQAAEEFAEAYRLSGRPQLLYNVYVAQRDAANWSAAIEALRSYLAMVPDAPDRITLRARLGSMEEQAARLKEQEVQAQAARQAAAQPTTRSEVERSPVPWVLIGTGSALAVSSIVTGIMARQKDDDVDKTCADGGAICANTERDAADKARRLAITTDVLWIAGAAAIVTGIVLRATGALDRERQVPVVSFDASRRGVSTALTLRY